VCKFVLELRCTIHLLNNSAASHNTMAPTNQARVIAGHASLSVIPRTRFICLQCRLQSSMLAREERLTRNNHSAQRHASSQTQWLRKKIWGTDNPPGQKDPYAKLTPEQQRQEQEEMELERQAMEEQNLEEESEGEDIPDELIDGLQRPGEYVPATTWHGLRSIRRKKWNAMHPYKGFATLLRLYTPHKANILQIHEPPKLTGPWRDCTGDSTSSGRSMDFETSRTAPGAREQTSGPFRRAEAASSPRGNVRERGDRGGTAGVRRRGIGADNTGVSLAETRGRRGRGGRWKGVGAPQRRRRSNSRRRRRRRRRSLGRTIS